MGRVRKKGHRKGINTVETIIKASIENKIRYLTLFAFSTENWQRPSSEVNYLFKLLETFLKSKINEFQKNEIRFKTIGEKKFSKKLNNLLISSEKKTQKNKQTLSHILRLPVLFYRIRLESKCNKIIIYIYCP